MNGRDYWLKKARKAGKENDWSTYRRLRKAAAQIIRHSKGTYIRSVFQVNINRPKLFWGKLRNFIQQNPQKRETAEFLNILGIYI